MCFYYGLFTTELFKAKSMRYVNEVLFEMVKISRKDTYLGRTTPTSLQNEVAMCRKMYHDKDNQVIINQPVNEFYTQFLFKIDALPQEVGFLLDIAATLFNNLSPDVRDILISEGVQVNQNLPTKTITKEIRGLYWSETQQWKQKGRPEQ